MSGGAGDAGEGVVLVVVVDGAGRAVVGVGVVVRGSGGAGDGAVYGHTGVDHGDELLEAGVGTDNPLAAGEVGVVIREFGAGVGSVVVVEAHGAVGTDHGFKVVERVGAGDAGDAIE